MHYGNVDEVLHKKMTDTITDYSELKCKNVFCKAALKCALHINVNLIKLIVLPIIQPVPPLFGRIDKSSI